MMIIARQTNKQGAKHKGTYEAVNDEGPNPFEAFRNPAVVAPHVGRGCGRSFSATGDAGWGSPVILNPLAK